MPVKDRNPFGQDVEATGSADEGLPNPFERPQSVIECPMCLERDPAKIATHNTPSQILRECVVCGNKWSCGTVGGAYMIPIAESPSLSVNTEPDIPEDYRMSGTDRWFGDD